jgi:hypothetical protein
MLYLKSWQLTALNDIRSLIPTVAFAEKEENKMKNTLLATIFAIFLAICFGNGALAENASKALETQPAVSSGNEDGSVFQVIEDPTEWVITNVYPDKSTAWSFDAKQKLNPAQCSWLYEEMAKSLANLKEPDFKGSTRTDFNYCLVMTYRQHQDKIFISLLAKRILFYSHGKTSLSSYNISKDGYASFNTKNGVHCPCYAWYDSHWYWLKRNKDQKVLEINIETDKRKLNSHDINEPQERKYPDKIIVIFTPPPRKDRGLLP